MLLSDRSSPLQKPKNADVRTREHLLNDEVEMLMNAAKATGRHGHRDATMILLAYRHGLRVTELASLKWEQVDFATGMIFINRLKKGTSSTQPLSGEELRALRKLQRMYPDCPHLFVSERKAAITSATARHVITRAGELAGLPFPVHPHMLRHACGYYLAAQGCDTRLIQAYLGHKQIQHTVRYTELAPGRFKGLWKD